jgi:REP element-mobilizing transposase RayT
MSTKYKFYSGGTFYVTLTVVGWIDVFTRKEYAIELLNNLNYCIDNKGFEVFCYCLMPSHLHLICRGPEGEDFGKLLGDYKSFTAKKLYKMIEETPQESRKKWMLHLFNYYAKFNSNNRNFQFWIQDNQAKDCFSIEFINQKRDYIHMNPLVAGLSLTEDNYPWSSANPLGIVKLTDLG